MYRDTLYFEVYIVLKIVLSIQVSKDLNKLFCTEGMINVIPRSAYRPCNTSKCRAYINTSLHKYRVG